MPGCGRPVMTCSSSATSTRRSQRGGGLGRSWTATSPRSSTRQTSGTPRTPSMGTAPGCTATPRRLGEQEPPATDGSDLVWLGRIDGEKAPHVAVMAAALLGRRIRVIGPVFDEACAVRHSDLFRADHIDMAGELGGANKTAALRAGRVLVYACARYYAEAGAAVFGESLRSGTPVAALAWRRGTCAEAALCDGTGAVATPRHVADRAVAAGPACPPRRNPRCHHPLAAARSPGYHAAHPSQRPRNRGHSPPMERGQSVVHGYRPRVRAGAAALGNYSHALAVRRLRLSRRSRPSGRPRHHPRGHPHRRKRNLAQ